MFAPLSTLEWFGDQDMCVFHTCGYHVQSGRFAEAIVLTRLASVTVRIIHYKGPCTFP